MARIKLEIPDQFPFSTTIALRITDLNYGGHLGNDVVLSLLHEARVRFLRFLHYTELEVEGLGIIMSDAAVVYKSEAFYGDEILIEVATADFYKVGFDFIYRLTHKTTGKEVARAKTGIVFYDYEKRKRAEVPAKFKEVCESL